MSNDLYIKYLMRRLIKYLNENQKGKVDEMIQKIMEELS
jgi:hypothetical protein